MNRLSSLIGLVDSFLKTLKVNQNLSDKTIRAYACDLRIFTRWLKRRKTMLAGKQVQEYYNHLMESGLKAASIRRKTITMNLFLKYCVAGKHIFAKEVPARPKGGFIVPRRLPKTMTDDKLVALFKAARKSVSAADTSLDSILAVRNLAIIEMLYSTGIRIGELSEANASDLSLEHGTVLIHGKGRKERLLFVSNGDVLNALKAWLKKRPLLRPSADALFLNRYGARLSIFGIEDVFAKMLE